MSDRQAELDRVIFVNRRRFTLRAATSTGADIAGLIGVPFDNAVVERETADGLVAVLLDKPLPVEDGEAFLVTRQFIMGGCSGHHRNAASLP